MPELLLFAWDHASQSVPRPSIAQLAALPKRYDVITVQPDGWRWGIEELAHPWFRVLAWPAANRADAQTLLTPLMPAVDSNITPTTCWQYRGFYLDLSNALVSPSLRAWFADEARAVPRLAWTTAGAMTVAALKTARPPIAIAAGGEL
jgi:hypothetical protein